MTGYLWDEDNDIERLGNEKETNDKHLQL